MARFVDPRRDEKKRNGAYYTPEPVARTLVSWAVRKPSDLLLDPSCGDGRFIVMHENSVGIEQDSRAAASARSVASSAVVIERDFFEWAAETSQRFDCAAGNPPFIRYQIFSGQTRRGALALCEALGAKFSRLTSSWAPFLVASAAVLRPGGRLAFVVPAEIGHAPYAYPLLSFLVANFSTVHLVAIRRKIFQSLSEDCWLLFADGFGGNTSAIRLSRFERFEFMVQPPRDFVSVSYAELTQEWGGRLRPFLLSAELRDQYRSVADHGSSILLSDIARVGIGYVTGANEFFHLRPSQAYASEIPFELLRPTVRNTRTLPEKAVTGQTVRSWVRSDSASFLLCLPKDIYLPAGVREYLESPSGMSARSSYKCRTRHPWYSVPHVYTPDFFLSYMSTCAPTLVANSAGCTGTNSVHMVRLHDSKSRNFLASVWSSDFVQLSCEIEGHPLGGGMLKLEPREAGNVVLPRGPSLQGVNRVLIEQATVEMREWRHHAS